MGRDDGDFQMERDRFDAITRRLTAIVSAVLVTVLARFASEASWRASIAIGLTMGGAFMFVVRFTGSPSAFMGPPSPGRPLTFPRRRSILLLGAGVLCLVLGGLTSGPASGVLIVAGSVAAILLVVLD